MWLLDLGCEGDEQREREHHHRFVTAGAIGQHADDAHAPRADDEVLADGRSTARGVDAWLMGASELPAPVQ